MEWAERHVSISYMHYLISNGILSNHQHGFRAHHSCDSSLTMIFEYLVTSIDRGDMNGMILIDFSKAFDLVNHKILIHKLTMYSTSPLALLWFKSYLSDRSQKLKLKGFLSNSLPSKTSVPQGSMFATSSLLLMTSYKLYGRLLVVFWIQRNLFLPYSVHTVIMRHVVKVNWYDRVF